MAQTRSFATIGPSLWNALPSSLRLTLLSGSLSASLSLLKTYFYSRGLRTGSAIEFSLPWAALYKFRNTIRCYSESMGRKRVQAVCCSSLFLTTSQVPAIVWHIDPSV